MITILIEVVDKKHIDKITKTISSYLQFYNSVDFTVFSLKIRYLSRYVLSLYRDYEVLNSIYVG